MDGSHGFIGLGGMGYPMASNLRKKLPPSQTLFINDINRSACERFVAEFSVHGPIEIVSSAKEAADKSKVVISIVPGATDVEDVYLDPVRGVVAAQPDPGRSMLECSTIDAETTRRVGRMLGESGRGVFVDAPVSGGVPAAKAGTLTFLIGHTALTETDPISQRLQAVISTMGDPNKLFYCGALGNGLAAKISNNYLAGTILLAAAEALAIGIRAGLDKHLLYQVIRNSTGQSFMCDNVHPVPDVVPHVPSSNGYEPGFKTQVMVKDMTLGVEAGEAAGIEPSMARTALEFYKVASEDPLCMDRDGSSIYLFIDKAKKKEKEKKN